MMQFLGPDFTPIHIKCLQGKQDGIFGWLVDGLSGICLVCWCFRYFVGGVWVVWLVCGYFLGGPDGLWMVSSFTANVSKNQNSIIAVNWYQLKNLRLEKHYHLMKQETHSSCSNLDIVILKIWMIFSAEHWNIV